MVGIQLSLFGKTCQEVYHQMTGLTLQPCCDASQMPTFNCLILSDGLEREWCEADAVILPGGYSTLNIGESPNVAVESSLSQILEGSVPDKYFLSATACAGILRRAERRGKKLPDMLRVALERQIASERLFKRIECPAIPRGDRRRRMPKLDSSAGDGKEALTLREREGCDGGGKGVLISNKSLTLGTRNDQVLCMATQQGGAEIANDLCPTITAAAGQSGNNQPVVCCRIDQTGSNGLGICEDVAYTLDSAQGQAVAIPVNTQVATRHKALGRGTGFGVGEPGDPAFTIQQAHSHAVATYQQVAGTLSPGAHPGGFNGQDAANDMLIANGAIVRRLTPTECERLQGFPDNWTAYGHDGKTISDSKRYSALGNSVAIPCVEYIMAGIVAEIEETT